MKQVFYATPLHYNLTHRCEWTNGAEFDRFRSFSNSLFYFYCFHSSLLTPRRATPTYGSRPPWKSELSPCKVNKLTPGRSLLSRQLLTPLKHHFNRWRPPMLPEINFLQVSRFQCCSRRGNFLSLDRSLTVWFEPQTFSLQFRWSSFISVFLPVTPRCRSQVVHSQAGIKPFCFTETIFVAFSLCFNLWRSKLYHNSLCAFVAKTKNLIVVKVFCKLILVI